jgi:glycosyltransferase involved in cell wall biosynthesis
MATYNGERFIEQQIDSLKNNDTKFTLHWLDDHSADSTRAVVRRAAERANITINEWHQPQRERVPGAFFRLMERVEADIYLFCDQDDIWQPGKIDATVAHLLPAISQPALCFSDPLMFRDDNPDECYHVLDIFGTTAEVAMRETQAFTSVVGYGHTQGFTRGLRDLFLTHVSVARAYAFMHDMWMLEVARATGNVSLLVNVPTTLFRRHRKNATGDIGGWVGSGRGRIVTTWPHLRKLRQVFSRNARGFLLAAKTLPPGPKLERLLETARIVASLDRCHSPFSILQVARHGILYPNLRMASKLAISCLLFDATSNDHCT